MKLKKTVTQATFCCALASAAVCAQAAALNPGDRLTITSGVYSLDANGNPTDVISGSWYGYDLSSGFSKISGTEKFALIGHTPGIIIGSIQPYGTLYPQTGPIDAYFFGGNQGQHYTTAPITGSTTAGLDFSGWAVRWGASDASAVNTPFGTGAWQPLNCTELGCTGHTFTNGNAWFQWDGVYGHSYTLHYTSRVPNGDASGTGDIQTYLYLEGTVQAVPLPAAVWLFGSGLVGLLGWAQRGKTPG